MKTTTALNTNVFTFLPQPCLSVALTFNIGPSNAANQSNSSTSVSNALTNILTNCISQSAASASSSNSQTQNTYTDFIEELLKKPPPPTNQTPTTPNPSSTPTTNPKDASNNDSYRSANSSTSLSSFSSQVNVTLLTEPSSRPQSTHGGGGSTQHRKKVESQIWPKLKHIFALFSSKTRIEIIAIETPEMVIQVLANGLHLEMEEQYFNSNWMQCMEKLNNSKFRKQLINFRLDEILHDLRYLRKSKVFILYSLKSDQFKLLVAP
jgi:hypothetical protein